MTGNTHPNRSVWGRQESWTSQGQHLKSQMYSILPGVINTNENRNWRAWRITAIRLSFYCVTNGSITRAHSQPISWNTHPPRKKRQECKVVFLRLQSSVYNVSFQSPWAQLVINRSPVSAIQLTTSDEADFPCTLQILLCRSLKHCT